MRIPPTNIPPQYPTTKTILKIPSWSPKTHFPCLPMKILVSFLWPHRWMIITITTKANPCTTLSHPRTNLVWSIECSRSRFSLTKILSYGNGLTTWYSRVSISLFHHTSFKALSVSIQRSIYERSPRKIHQRHHFRFFDLLWDLHFIKEGHCSLSRIQKFFGMSWGLSSNTFV